MLTNLKEQPADKILGRTAAELRLADALEWREVSGAATLYSWTVCHRAPAPPFAAWVPFVLAVAFVHDWRMSSLALVALLSRSMGKTGSSWLVVLLGVALPQAGAAGMLTSLWPVPDTETTEFMQRFHRTLAGGRSPAAALQETALAMREHRPHPFFWAPFALMGHGGPLAPG